MPFIYRTIAIFGLLAPIAFTLSQRPLLIRSSISEPDGIRAHPVAGAATVGQRFIVPTDTLAAIEFQVDPRSSASTDIPLVFHLRLSASREDMLTLHTTFSEVLKRSGASSSILFQIPLLHDVGGLSYDVIVEAPSLTKKHALWLAFQIDSEKFSDGVMLARDEARYGDLAFTLYEKPTRATLIQRWLAAPNNAPVWVGIILIAVGTAFRHLPKLEGRLRTPHDSLTYFSWKQALPWITIIFVMTFIIWLPAKKLFFFHDDVPTILRVQQFLGDNPFLLLTARPYIDPDPESQFGFRFYRPLSGSLYPALLLTMFGPNASVFLTFNLILFSLLGCLLFILTFLLLRSYPTALLATVLWASHSTKLGTMYWWSSVQDILASLFTVAAMISYIAFRSNPGIMKKFLMLLFFLLAIASKEHAIMVPAILVALDMLFQRRHKQFSRALQSTLISIAPLIILGGAYICIWTYMLSDPFEASERATDPTYAMSASPQWILHNTVIYASASAERWLWPVMSIDDSLQKMLWRSKIPPPYYPGIIFCSIYAISLWIFWHNTRMRAILLFSGFWWTLFLAPHLLMTQDWRERWLMLPIWGSSITVTALISYFAKFHLKKSRVGEIMILLSFCVATYGFWVARYDEKTRFYTDQSNYTREANTQFQLQKNRVTGDTIIYLVGIPTHQYTSLNAFLFRLYSPASFASIMRSNTVPVTLRDQDIVIDMRTVRAYYPEYER